MKAVLGASPPVKGQVLRDGLARFATICRVHQRLRKTALRAVAPSSPPPLTPPAKAPGEEGGPSGIRR